MEKEKRPVFVISAPSGSGKSTMVKALMEHFDCFGFSVSATTRLPRGEEKEGIHYYFLSEADFKQKIEEGKFLEWEEVYPGRFYGTLRSEIDRISASGRFPIFDVDVVGGLNINAQYGDRACAIFIKTPGLEVLAERLRFRATDSEDSIKERIDKAKEEIEYAEHFDHIIVNDQLDEAISELLKIVGAQIADYQSQA